MSLDALDAIKVTHEPPLSVYQPLRQGQEAMVGDTEWEALAAALEDGQADQLVTVSAAATHPAVAIPPMWHGRHCSSMAPGLTSA